MSTFVNELRFAVRTLFRKPGFVLACVTTIALGVGANTAVFSVAETVLWRPLEYQSPDELVALWPDRSMSTREVVFVRENSPIFERIATVAGWTMALTGDSEPTQVFGARTSANLFSLLGVVPQFGRVFREEDGYANANLVTVLSDRLWRSRFGADTSVIGRAVVIDGEPHEVIGVMPTTFEILNPTTTLWVPLREDPTHWTYGANISRVIGRLAPGATLVAANEQFVRALEGVRASFGYADDYGTDAGVVTLKTFLVGRYDTMFWVLLGAVGFILLIAGSNLSNLLLVQGGMRRREMALRAALGAKRSQLARIVIAESVVIGVLGGLAGVVMAYGGIEVLRDLVPAHVPRVANTQLDARLFSWCMIFAVGVGVAFTLWPAYAASNVDLKKAIGAGRFSRDRPAALSGLRSFWVSCQVGVAVVLVVGSGLMIRTMKELTSVDLGFAPSNVLTLRVHPTGARYETPAQYRQFYANVFDRLSALPTVLRAGAVQHLPLSGWSWGIPFEIEGSPLAPGEARPVAGWRIVTGDYLQTIGVPLLAGRSFAPADHESGEQVVLVNRSLAERFWGNQDVLGRQMRLGRQGETRVTVVGVVGDVRHESAGVEPAPELYRPLSQSTMPALMLAIRGSVDFDVLADHIQEAIWSIDDGVPISHIVPYDDLVASTMGQPRLVMLLLTTFAVVAVLLAAIGVYGVTSFVVARRTNESVCAWLWVRLVDA